MLGYPGLISSLAKSYHQQFLLLLFPCYIANVMRKMPFRCIFEELREIVRVAKMLQSHFDVS